jgi:hypothetical protein
MFFYRSYNTLFEVSIGEPLRNYVARKMRGKVRDILILWRITHFSTTGSAGLKRRNNGRNSLSVLSIFNNY